MSKKPNTHGGGAQTNTNGLTFEQTTSLDEALKSVGYSVNENIVRDTDGNMQGYSVQKFKLYSAFLEPSGIDFKKYNSKKWLPDECFINTSNKTAYIIEKKFQNCSGSVDEKLPGCDFKKKEYVKLFAPLGYEVEYLYVFNDWFLQDVYKDTLDYIKDVGCTYYFNAIPLDFLGL